MYIESPETCGLLYPSGTSRELERFAANWVSWIVGGADLVGGEENPPMNYHLIR